MGNEMQFGFNTGLEDSVASAWKQLEKMAPIDKAENASLKKVTKNLNKGATLLKMCQRHYQGGRLFWIVMVGMRFVTIRATPSPQIVKTLISWRQTKGTYVVEPLTARRGTLLHVTPTQITTRMLEERLQPEGTHQHLAQ